MPNSSHTLDDIVALTKRRGFVFQTSEIYGGLANSYDYGPLGVELLRNIKKLWWREFITKRIDMVGLDSQIMLHPDTWVASGHVGSFSDPLVEDKVTHKRYRADHLIENYLNEQEPNNPTTQQPNNLLQVEDMTVNDMATFIQENNVLSPEGNPITEPKSFNLLFETAIGSVAGEKATVYLRGETAQGIFSDFKNILSSTRVQLPFGVGQLGKSFRNEVTTGQFVFRTLEFEQGEIEYFFDPKESDWKVLMQEWKDAMWKFVTETLGIREEKLRWRQHTDTERSHYSLDTYDLEYEFPFGWKELWGLAYRTNYDLTQQANYSRQDLTYTHPQTGKKILPHVIEPAVGINRLFLMILDNAYRQDQEKNRTVLQINTHVAPYQVAVFPLVKNKPELVNKAKEIFKNLLDKNLSVAWDDRGNIGKRYLSQDEIGTPYCVTVDYQTLEDETVTVRDRDTTEQKRVKMEEIIDILFGK